MSKKFLLTNPQPWQQALSVLAELEAANQKLNYYLSALFQKDPMYGISRAYVLNVVKRNDLIEYFLKKCLHYTPKLTLKCFLKLVLGRLLQLYLSTSDESKSMAPLVNGWISRSKQIFSLPECKFINAVLRKILPEFKTLDLLPLSVRYSTPEWFIERYSSVYGQKALLEFLKWNEGLSTTYVHSNFVMEGMEETQWPHFYTVKDAGVWKNIFVLIKQGKIYIQDPMTRIPVELLNVGGEQNVLDLCSAPGGKTVQLAKKVKAPFKVVSVDLPKHTKRLYDNVANYSNVHVVEQDILNLTEHVFEEMHLPKLYERVLIDVPCSNTGVIRRKPDVVYRLQPDDFISLPKFQYELLCKASRFVSTNGLLVYSTCSIDVDENQGVVDRFLRENSNFSLEASHMSLPWVDGHDGGGAFCLKRNA